MTEYLKDLKFAVVPQDFLEKMEREIGELKVMLRQKSEAEKNEEWIESTKIPKLLNVSRKTYQDWRNKRLLAFSQIGSKIYIKKSDLEKFMLDHYIEAHN